MGRNQSLQHFWQRISLVRLAQNALVAVVTLQIITVVVLGIASALRKRRKHEVSFPHLRLDEVQIDKNCLQLLRLWP